MRTRKCDLCFSHPSVMTVISNATGSLQQKVILTISL